MTMNKSLFPVLRPRLKLHKQNLINGAFFGVLDGDGTEAACRTLLLSKLGQQHFCMLMDYFKHRTVQTVSYDELKAAIGANFAKKKNPTHNSSMLFVASDIKKNTVHYNWGSSCVTTVANIFWYFYALLCILLGYFKDEVDCAQTINNTAMLKLFNAEGATIGSKEKHVNSFDKNERDVQNINEESLITNPPCDDKSCSDLPSIFIDAKCCRDENGRNLGQCCKKLSLLTKILISIASFGATMGLLFVAICFSNGKCCLTLRKSLNIRRKPVIDESANLTNFKHAQTLERSLSNGKKLNDMNRTFQESLIYSKNSKIDSALLDFVQSNSPTSPSLSRFSKTAESELMEHFESARNLSTILSPDAGIKPTLGAESCSIRTAEETQEPSVTGNETNIKSESNESEWNEASKNETELPLEKPVPIHDSTHNTLNSQNPSSSANIANSNACDLSAEFTAASSKRDSTLASHITEDKSGVASDFCDNTSATKDPQKEVTATSNLSKSSTSNLT
ncbi:Zinc finger protein [Trichinella spiralis]|uniref:Zinc finger protein n=1 Tax=Trichinella spiralis TaxID=6334 RepID=A0ABR3KDA5_TRISP